MQLQKYSVLMSVYYKEKPEFLSMSIDSMLNQTVKPDEFIIVKDGPLTLELDSVISEYVMKFPHLFHIISFTSNQGLGKALAKGIIAAKNELVVRMDSDDYSVNNRCERELEEFARNPKLDVVGCFEAEFVNDINNIIAIHKVPESSAEIKKFMRRRCALLHPTVMYRKSAVLRCGNYESVPLYEDYDLFARMVLQYDVTSYNIQEPLYFIRTSEDFFRRRGGIKYAKTVFKFKWKMYQQGFMSMADFIISGVGQVVVCLLPNGLRKFIYVKFLRK